MIDKRLMKDFDYKLVALILLVFVMGLFFLYSASQQKGSEIGKNFTLNQLAWMAFGILALLVIINISYHKLIDIAYILYGMNVLLLVLVLIAGGVRLGSQRWLDFGGMSFQPSELAKVVVILALARYLGYRESKLYKLRDLAVPFLIVLIPIILIVKQPNLGTALIFLPILFSMLYIWGARMRHLAWLFGCGVILTPLVWRLLKDYQRDRFLVFIDPNLDPLGAGYTIIQSKIAIGSGRLLGKGWLAGTQNQLNFLPERHTDFIFSVVGEEWGFLGATLVILLYFIIVIWALSIVKVTNDISGKLLVTGIVTMLSFHIVVNIGMTIGLMPVVGLPLPLISYGGSNLLTTMISIGLLLNVRMRRSVF